MVGTKLISGNISDYAAAGAEGAPVYASAEQLRVAIRKHLGQDTADVFAIPKPSDRGNIIEWYAPVRGRVVPWSAATSDEKIATKATLMDIQARMLERSQALKNSESAEQQLFGRLLEKSVRIPSDSHIYLVGGKPVISFWGFDTLNAELGGNVIKGLAVAQPVEDASNNEVPPVIIHTERKRSIWPWLLLLLLLIAAFLGWAHWSNCRHLPFMIPALCETIHTPASADEPVIEPVEEWNVPDDAEIQTDDDGREYYVNDKGERVYRGGDRSTVQRDGRTLNQDNDVVDNSVTDNSDDIDNLADSADMNAPESDELSGADDADVDALSDEMSDELPMDDSPMDEVPNDDELASDDIPDEEGLSDEALPEETLDDGEQAPEGDGNEEGDDVSQPDDEQASDEAQPNEDQRSEQPPTDQNTQPQTPPSQQRTQGGNTPPAGSGELMSIPENVPTDAGGAPEFMQGEWKASSQIKDAETGESLDMQYDIGDDGTGTAKVKRSDGTVCSGPVRTANGSGGAYQVRGQGAIRCPDGVTYQPSNVECKRTASGNTHCNNQYDNGQKFPVRLRRPAE